MNHTIVTAADSCFPPSCRARPASIPSVALVALLLDHQASEQHVPSDDKHSAPGFHSTSWIAKEDVVHLPCPVRARLLQLAYLGYGRRTGDRARSFVNDDGFSHLLKHGLRLHWVDAFVA